MTRSIRKRALVTVSAMLIAAAPASARAQAKPFAGLDDYIASAMKDWKVPGVAVGIVRNDSVVYMKGFGVRTLGRPEKVDEHTLFALASDSKQFTGMLMAMLVDDGKIRWDAPLTTYLPTLKFGDDVLTRELTVRDAASRARTFSGRQAGLTTATSC